jgi:hypothetical protein
MDKWPNVQAPNIQEQVKFLCIAAITGIKSELKNKCSLHSENGLLKL